MDKELLTAGNMKQFVARSMDPNAGSEAYEKMDMYVDSLGGNIVNSFKLLENKGNGNFVFGTSKPFTFKVNYKLYEDEDPLKFTFTYDEVLITYKDYLIDNYYLHMTYEFSIGNRPYTYSLVSYVDYEYNVENPFNVTYENPDVERSAD